LDFEEEFSQQYLVSENQEIVRELMEPLEHEIETENDTEAKTVSTEI
jgi:hypothetical protein